MKKIYLIITFLISNLIYSQVVINELDADNVGADTKEFVELKSTAPNFSLNGYVLVFFNGGTGSGTLSYQSIDLDGFSTDANGIIVIGNALVSPTPQVIIPNASIQSGPDVIALYQGNASDFPVLTPAVSANLINAIAYTTVSNTIFATSLMAILGITVSTNENLNSNLFTESIQRKNDGTFEVKAPTPGVNNDGSGIIFNYLSFTSNVTSLNEGQNLTLNFSLSQVVSASPFTFNFTLNNDNFNSTDFSGSQSVTIQVGQSTGSATFSILNDGINEGDEEIKVVITPISLPYIINNNNLIVRVVDLNFSVLPFGTPANPTFGIVANTKPASYYDSLNGLSGAALKQEIQNIIANPNLVQAQSYGDVYDILKDADQNPANSSQVWLIYTEEGRSKLDQQFSSSIIGKWNREHIYAQSRGGFTDGTSSFSDGINVWLPTGPNDILTGHSDAHHIRAVDGSENSSRNNKNYGTEYNGPSGSTSNAWKGDVARSLFYMAVRYNGLNVVNGNPAESPDGFIGDLATLLNWNTLDAADDFEMNRNNIIYNWQKNRNPFIDMPNLVSYVFGNNTGQPWSNSLSVSKTDEVLQVKMHPNPATNFIAIDGLINQANIEIFNTIGEKVSNTIYNSNEKLNFNLASGIYLVKIISENKSVVKKLVID
jgi:hypothetical protein